MEIRLPKEKIVRTYQRFSLPIQAQEPLEVKKLAFFYIGTQAHHIQKLSGFFEFGYATISPGQAIYTLKRFLNTSPTVTIPDVIIADAGIGIEKLTELHRFASGCKMLADMPFIVEGTSLSHAGITELKRYAFIDEILFLDEFSAPALLQKLSFLKKVKQQWVRRQNSCKVEKSFPLFPDMRSFFKRVLDIAIAAVLLVALSPLLLLIALAVRLESPGPVLQGYKKIGRGFRLFNLLKFRTGSKAGLFIRKTGLDNLPQLFNVLVGDLSLAGNRPLSPGQAARLTTDACVTRFLAPAGLTGLWQFRKSSEELPAEEYLETDNGFAGQSDLVYDLWALANTPQLMIQKTNA